MDKEESKHNPDAQKVRSLADKEARKLGHNFVGTELLLLALVQYRTGMASCILSDFGLTVEKTRAEMISIIGRGSYFCDDEIPLTPKAKHVIERAGNQASQLGHDSIGSEHLLLALVLDDESVAARMLKNLGADPKSIRQRVERTLKGEEE